MRFQPLQLERRLEPLSPGLAVRIKYDGFVLWLRSSTGDASFVLRNGNEFKSFRTLCESLGTELKRSSTLDGEIVCLDGDGKSLFYHLLFRRGQPRFIALDLLHCDGQDLTYSPRSNASKVSAPSCPRIARACCSATTSRQTGEGLLALACKSDLEGIVAKRKFGPYLQDSAQWFKIRNRKYSQWAGREKFFEREREVDLI